LRTDILSIIISNFRIGKAIEIAAAIADKTFHKISTSAHMLQLATVPEVIKARKIFIDLFFW